MTDVLLIQPPIRDFYLTHKRTIPYGLASIAAVLIKAGFSVAILDALATSKSRAIETPPELSYLHDYYAQPDRSPFALFNRFKHFGHAYAHIAERAKASQAFLVGISSLFSPYMKEAIETAEKIKAHHPACKIVLGGHHPTALPQTVMKSTAVDFILRGEGEVGIVQLARAVKNGESCDDIPGLVYRQTNGSLKINRPACMPDPDQYPLPATHLIKHEFYKRGGTGSAVVVASRGCPLKCSYCSVGASADLPFRRRRVSSVIREIDTAVKKHQVGFIDFEDENLSLDRPWFLKLLHAIKAHFGRYHLELRAMNGLFPPSLDAEIVGAMQAAGFKTLNLSLGSISTAQLKKFQRPDVREAFEHVLELAQRFDLNAVGYIIVAAPDQSAHSSLADLLYLAGRRVLAGISVFYPAPGSPDYDRCSDLGILPQHFACMRSSALPLSHTTNRLQSITLLRLGRILNFMKLLVDKEIPIPEPLPPRDNIHNPADRLGSGMLLLQHFLHDGKIRGVSPEGRLFEHKISTRLTKLFLEGLKNITVKGAR